MSMRKQLLLGSVELKFAKADSSAFTGYASVFGGVDSYSDTIMPGAYKSVIERIQSGSARMPKMFVNHRSYDLPLVKWVKMAEDDKGLLMEGELTPGNPQAATVKAGMQHETIDGLSIGYALKSADYDMIETDGKEIRVIKNISELYEVSIVTYPGWICPALNLLWTTSRQLRTWKTSCARQGAFQNRWQRLRQAAPSDCSLRVSLRNSNCQMSFSE